MQQPSFDFGPIDDGGNPTFTVSELADAINAQLNRGFYEGVWVRGEIDGLRHSGPHTYFSLVEHTDEGRAVVSVSLFAPTKRRLTPLLRKNRLELANGVKVRINGHLDYYAPNGRLGLKMSGLDPTFTVGELSQQRDQVVRRLVATGMYDANRQRPMPALPLRVGVVASVGTAAWHDFHDELDASGFGFDLAVADVRVQGPTAVGSVSAAIHTLQRLDQLDAIVVVRGGGARTELAVFDAEQIAVAVAMSRVPVITGLGHEIDRSVADDVAHTALKTPTAVARHLTDRVDGFKQRLNHAWSDIAAAADHQLGSSGTDLAARASRVQHQLHVGVDRAAERLDARSVRLSAEPLRRLSHLESALERRSRQLAGASPRRVADAERHLDGIAARVDALNPINLMRRGWSITRHAETGEVLTAAGAQIGTPIVTQLADGTVESVVDNTAPTVPSQESDHD